MRIYCSGACFDFKETSEDQKEAAPFYLCDACRSVALDYLRMQHAGLISPETDYYRIYCAGGCHASRNNENNTSADVQLFLCARCLMTALTYLRDRRNNQKLPPPIPENRPITPGHGYTFEAAAKEKHENPSEMPTKAFGKKVGS